jgi:hypothetical protein
LLLTGVVATALMGGMTVGVSSAGAATTAKLEVCKAGNVSGSFQFSLNNGTPFSVASGSCATKTVASGTNQKVTELADPTGATVLSAIAIAPAADKVSTSVATRTAVVKVPAGAEAVATFTNKANNGQLKVCKVAGNSALLGQSFSFTESAGGNTVGPFAVNAGTAAAPNCGGLTTYQVGTNVNIAETAQQGIVASNISVSNGSASNVNLSGGTVTATVGAGAVTIVTYTNVPVINQPTGAIEVCKQAGDSYVNGSFNFSLSEGEWSSSVSVLTGQCSGEITVPAGQVSVTEAPSAPYYLASVSSIPQSALLGSNLANGQATFAVSSGSATTAIFTNATELGYVKVCKTLTSGSGALTGDTFNFNVSDAAGNQAVSVIAPAPGQTACALDFTALPVGSVAHVTEVGQPNVALTGVSVYPSSSDAGSTSTTGAITVGTSVASATFTNEALGWVEVCKNAADPSTGNQIFPFTVNGGQVFTVMANQCSQAFQVPAGTATINEIQANPNFYLENVTAIGGWPTTNRLLSGPTDDPATVTVPFGGVGNETVATFTDAVYQGSFKICTAQTSPDANLAAGQLFVYNYSYTVNGTTTTGSVTLTNPATGATCSGIIGPIPVVNADGSAVQVSVTEALPATPSVQLANVQYQGNGMVVSSPALPSTLPATIVFTNGAGMNVATFTDGRTP